MKVYGLTNVRNNGIHLSDVGVHCAADQIERRDMKSAQDFVDEIFAATTEMSDSDYCDFLDEISSACSDAADVKREEMSRQE